MYKKTTYKIRFRNHPELDRITIEDSDLDWVVDGAGDCHFGLMFKYTAHWWVPQLGKDIIGTKWVVPGNKEEPPTFECAGEELIIEIVEKSRSISGHISMGFAKYL